MKENNEFKEKEEIKEEVQEEKKEEEKKEESKEETKVQEVKEDKKNSILIISIVAFLIIVIGIYLALAKNLVKENNTNTQKETEEKEEQKEETKDETQSEVLNYTLNVYKNKNDYLCQEYDATYCNTVAYTIKTKTENAKIVTIQDSAILYDDGGLKIYNINDKQTTTLNLKNEYKNYSLKFKDSKVIGVIYCGEATLLCEKGGYYNVNTKEKMYDLRYDDIGFVYDDSNYLTASKGKNAYLLNINREKEEIVTNTDSDYNYFFVYKNNDKNFYYVTDREVYNAYKFYSNDKKLIFDKKLNEGTWTFKDKYLYVVDDKVVKKYDIDGTLASTSASLNNIKGLIENYVVYVEDSKLSLKNVDNNESVVLGQWSDDYRFDNWGISGVYTREKLDSIGEKNKPEGVYVVVYFKEKDAKGRYGIEYCYTKGGTVQEFEVTTPEGGRAKPVLYLYPTKTTNVKVEFEHPEYLTTTYPKYNKSWEVKAYPNGDLYDKDNKYYYGLYWDEVRYNEVDFHEGFYVTKDKAIDFLEEKLDIIGLNPREKNEFIMYWLPILESNEKSLVYFELTKEREMGNKLLITPKPDSMLRVSIHIKKVNDYVNIKEQRLETFKRVGFTAIEWGGMTY